MKKYTNIYMLALAILLLFCGCEKGPELTPVTQEGKNTFSCKVNGKVWVPDGRGDIFVSVKPINGGFYSNPFNGSINIEIVAHDEDGEEIDLFLRTTLIGLHDLNKATKKTGELFFPENYGFYHSVQGKDYITSNKNVGRIIVTKADTISGIIAGTFEFEAATATNQVVKITNGRFDIKSPQ